MRAAYGYEPRSPRIIEVVETLSAKSPEFAELWARHHVKGKNRQTKNPRHARVGDLRIQFSAFTVNEVPDQQLVVYQADPGSPTAAAFTGLRSRTGDRRAEPEQHDAESKPEPARHP
ncbi:hypothetical protein ACFVTC_29735 [Streptomyces sp. NPDC057950]|uniref:MmyB family transcriptional regulator n=1 Tax=Streptomyces sp. NPDC057950 TaxID=3346288 RepID=UPI0036E60431